MSRTLSRPVLIRRPTSPVDMIAAAFRTAVGHVGRELRIRRDRRHLASMPDHILKDIGIDRSEVVAMTRSGRTAYRTGRRG